MRKFAWFSRSLCRAFCAASLLIALSVQAQWTPLGRNDSFRVYLDPKLIEMDGDFARVWQLMDFVTAQWADAQTVVGSIKTLTEYDCSSPRWRTLASQAYSEQLAEGRMVASERLPDPQWEGVEAGGTADKVRQIACAKK